MKTFKHFLLTLAMLLCSTSVSSHSFEAGGIFYNYVNKELKTVEVTFQGNHFSTVTNDYYGHVTIPERVDYGGVTYTVVRIGYMALNGCENVTGVTIPSTVTSIGIAALGVNEAETDFTTVNITDLSAWCRIEFESLASNALSKADSFMVNGELVTDLVIPDDINEIKNHAFSGYKSLESVKFHSGVTSIGEDAFSNCSGLTSVTIPESVTSIGSNAFAYCDGLTEVYCLASSVPENCHTAFYNYKTSNATLHVPAESLEAYTATAPWSGFGEIVALPAEEVELTIGSTGATTFCSEYALDFTEAEGVKVYAATGYNTSTGVVTLTRVKTAKAGTGLFVVGNEGRYNIPIIDSSADNSLNMLVGVTEDVTIPTADETYTNYIYGKSGDTSGFFKLTGEKEIPAGKAYLQIPTLWFPTPIAEANIRIEFEDSTTTGIDDTEKQVHPNDGVIYDLQGRVVKNPGKGIYIVNGKKVLF